MRNIRKVVINEVGPMKRKIDFLIVGAQKSGTTSLYDYVGQHHGVFLPRAKEIRYFADDEFYNQGEKYLDFFYKDVAQEQIIGGGYVHLMYHPYTPERIYKYNKNARIIAILRNPIDRAYSAYWFARQNRWETAASFEEALALEPKRRGRGDSKERVELTYLAHGHYYEQILRFVDLFGREKVKILLTDDLRSQPKPVVQEVLAFLGVEPVVDGIDLGKLSNSAKTPRVPALQRLLTIPGVWYRRLGRRVLPQGVRDFMNEQVTKRLIMLNTKDFSYPPMKPETRARLKDYFRSHNEDLAEFLGRDLIHWQ